MWCRAASIFRYKAEQFIVAILLSGPSTWEDTWNIILSTPTLVTQKHFSTGGSRLFHIGAWRLLAKNGSLEPFVFFELVSCISDNHRFPRNVLWYLTIHIWKPYRCSKEINEYVSFGNESGWWILFPKSEELKAGTPSKPGVNPETASFPDGAALFSTNIPTHSSMILYATLFFDVAAVWLISGNFPRTQCLELITLGWTIAEWPDTFGYFSSCIRQLESRNNDLQQTQSSLKFLV